MKNVSKKILKAAAKISLNTAVNAGGSASYVCYHQPKEPIALKKMIKK